MKNFKKWNYNLESNSVSEHARAGGMGNHLIPFSGSEASDWPEGISNFTFWCPIPHNIGTMSLAFSEAELLPKLECHTLKSFLTSYSTCTQFLALRSIWGFWKWSQMIPYTPKHWCCHQNHVFSIFRSWVTPEVYFLKSFLAYYSPTPTTQFLAKSSV